MTQLTLEFAHRITAAAEHKANEIGVPMNIAIVDAGANLQSFVRMDNAWLGSIDIAVKKARTARFFDMDSKALGPMTQPGQPLYNIEVSNGGLISFPGGVLLRDADGEIIGAVGVSGGLVDQDETVAQAAVAAVTD